MLNQRKKPVSLSWMLILLVVLAPLGGCGKKAPPMAPRQRTMKAVKDLKARHHKGSVTLTWRHRPSDTAVTGYIIYRFQQERSASDCPGCPLLFEKMETIALEPKDFTARHKLTWSQDVSSGHRYTYKVVPISPSGSYGVDSNMVSVEAFE